MDDDKIKAILLKLPGFVLDTETEELSDLDYEKAISIDELEDAFKSATNYGASFCRRDELPENEMIVDTAIEFWTAGLLWKKYDIRSNDQEDETNTIGFGDNLIIQAKQMLKPYKFFEFKAW